MKKHYPLLLLSVLLFAGALNSQQITFGYDAAGNRVSRTILIPPSSAPQAVKIYESVTEQLGDERQLKIYPNPTKGILTVEIIGGNTEDDIRFTLYNLQGIILQQIESVVGSTKQVDMSAYPIATYILRLHAGDKIIDYKIIKQ